MALANMTQQETDQENREHCKRIAEDIDDYATGKCYRCSECDETLTIPDDVGDKYRCPSCGTVHEVDDLEPLSIYDYMDDVLDLRYIVERDRKTVRSVEVLVAFGGPNIWVSTESQSVELYWWTDRASYPLSNAAVEALDDWAQEGWMY